MTGVIPNNEITIFLSPADAELFKSFREYQTEFMILKNTGIFDLKNGKMIINKDSTGNVREIEVREIKFKI